MATGPTAASPTSSSTPAPTLSSPSAPTTAGGWAPVPEQPSVQGVQFLDVVWTGSRFVAVGTALGGDGVFLDSPDGLLWHRQAATAAKAYPSRLAVGQGRIVAVGTIDDHQASWASKDGLTWTARADAFPMPPIGIDTFGVGAVVAMDAGWLAVGNQAPECHTACGLDPVRALVWKSTDGLHWARVADQDSFHAAGMASVVRAGPGFVAAGVAAGHAVVWTSTDGSVWTRVRDDPMFHARPGTDGSLATWIAGLATGHGVIVAVGMDAARGGGDNSVRAWWSVNGRSWTEATGDRFLAGQAFGVTATPDGFLATGPSGEPSCLGGIWASTDGRAWQCVAADPAFSGFGPYATAASSSVVVAVGLTSVAEPPPLGLPGAVWRKTLP